MKIKVGACRYEVVIGNVKQDDTDSVQLGLCDYANQKITINKQQTKEKKEQTFIHELVHAMFYEGGLNEGDEETVNRVALILYQVLKENDIQSFLSMCSK